MKEVYFRVDLSGIDSRIEGNVHFTRKWFEGELEIYFNNCKFYYDPLKKYLLPFQRKLRCEQERKNCVPFSPLTDIDIVFLAGGTCRIPSIQKQIGKLFPNTRLIIEEKLETITTTGAAIHVLQVLDKEVQPYILPIQHPVACGIRKTLYKFEIDIYDVRTKEKSKDSHSENKPIQEIVDELMTKYGNDIEKIVIQNNVLKSDELEYFKKENLKKHGDLVHVATKQELDFKYYFESKVKYSVGELIIWFNNWRAMLYECKEVADGRVTWKLLDRKEYQFDKQIDFEYIERMFKLKINQVHAVFEDSQEMINSLYGSEFNKYRFKSINFIKIVNRYANKALLLAMNSIADPEASVLVQVKS